MKLRVLLRCSEILKLVCLQSAQSYNLYTIFAGDLKSIKSSFQIGIVYMLSCTDKLIRNDGNVNSLPQPEPDCRRGKQGKAREPIISLMDLEANNGHIYLRTCLLLLPFLPIAGSRRERKQAFLGNGNEVSLGWE